MRRYGGYGRYGADHTRYDRDHARPRYGREYGGGFSGQRSGGYGRGLGGRYDRDLGGGYGRDFRPGGGPRGTGPYDATGWAPYTFAPFGWDPILGWAGWGAGVGYEPSRAYGPPPEPRPVPPRESATYGRGGDRALRRWAARYGYDFEYTIRPRPGGWRQHNREER